LDVVDRVRVMRSIPNVKHFSPECEIKSLSKYKLLFDACVAVDQPGTSQGILAAISERRTSRDCKARRRVPLQKSPLLLRRSDTVGELEGTVGVEVVVGDHAKRPSTEVAEQTTQLPAAENACRVPTGLPFGFPGTPAFLVRAAQTNKSPTRLIKADRALGEARGYATRSGSPLLKPNRRKSH